MIQSLSRLAKRFAVLIPGIIIAFLSVGKVFPYFDQRLPLGIAVFVTYLLGAYVFVPALLRGYRIFVPAKHVPLYCITPDGFASDPLNIGIIATRRQLINGMEKAGWYVADPHRFRNLVRQGFSAAYGWSYPRAPVSNLYLFGRKHDIAFEIPVEGAAVGGRHHVRFWATTYDENQPLSFRTIHWQHRKTRVHADNLLWVGAASLDVGINLIRHNLQLTHMIDPDTNKERDLIVSGLKAKQLVTTVKTVKLGEPYRLINRVINGSLHTDGKMDIVSLKKKSVITN